MPKSITSALPSGAATTMKPPPPRPLIQGSSAHRAREAASAASTALPPASSTSAPTLAAPACWAATRPPVPTTTDLCRDQVSCGEVLTRCSMSQQPADGMPPDHGPDDRIRQSRGRVGAHASDSVRRGPSAESASFQLAVLTNSGTAAASANAELGSPRSTRSGSPGALAHEHVVEIDAGADGPASAAHGQETYGAVERDGVQA